MLRILKLRTVLTATLLAATLAVAGTSTAEAGYRSYYRSYSSCCSYQRVTTFEHRKVLKQIRVKVYDHCGCPRYVTKTVCQIVRVPITRLVKVCH